jgi:hypothetical protein
LVLVGQAGGGAARRGRGLLWGAVGIRGRGLRGARSGVGIVRRRVGGYEVVLVSEGCCVVVGTVRVLESVGLYVGAGIALLELRQAWRAVGYPATQAGSSIRLWLSARVLRPS